MSTVSRLLPISVLFAAVVLVGPGAGLASATTIDDLVKLKANKTAPVSDDVLIALIESDGSVFHLTADDILPLKQRGLSERVIIAMLLTAKNARAERDAVEPPPVDQPDDFRQGPGAAATAPPIVTVTQSNVQTIEQPRHESRPTYTPAYVPVYVPVAVPVRQAPAPQPVYWGWGGQRRPDAWAPDPAKTPSGGKKPDVKPDPKKGGSGQ